MAAVNEDISDRELRTKLKEHGISCGPITATTKNLYIRKLNRKLSEGGSAPSNSKIRSRKSISPKASPRRAPVGRRSVDPTTSPGRRLIGFSSDEEDTIKEPIGTRQNRSHEDNKPSPKRSTRLTKNPIEDSVVQRRRSQLSQYASSSKPKLFKDRNNFGNNESSTVVPYKAERTREKLPSLARLKNLFLRKTIDDSKKYSNSSPSVPRKIEMAYDLEDDEEADENLNRYIWPIVTILAIFAVLLLSICYWPFFVDIFGKSIVGNKLQICGSNSDKKNVACLQEDELIKLIIKELRDHLGYLLGSFKCGNSTSSSNMTQTTFTKWLEEHSIVENSSITTEKLSHFVVKYPCGILCFDKDGEVVSNPKHSCDILTAEMALKPLKCRIKEAFSRVFYQLLFLFFAIVISIGIYFIVKYRWMLRERRTRQMFELVDRILEVLKAHHNECKQNKELSSYLAIPHVRDMLIKPSERQAMKFAWDDAVRFLSAQESRVRVESQRIAGEDFEVWRLLHHASPSCSSSPSGSNVKQGKVWQGTAFENFSTAVNPPLISPTPCLKIRNMFEPVMETQEEWHVFIQDAVLEKCSEKGAAIVHISVDKSSNEGCVYVKCANHRSSGAAFRAIHGCWFDGRLITVKFLTLKRYHQRFPASLDAQEHLKPSGTSCSTIPRLESAPVNESDSDSES